MTIYENTRVVLFELTKKEPVFRNARVKRLSISPFGELLLTCGLPDGKWLLELSNGASFEIVHIKNGDRSIYENGAVLFYLSDCTIVERYINDVVSIGGLLTVTARITCGIEMPTSWESV